MGALALWGRWVYSPHPRPLWQGLETAERDAWCRLLAFHVHLQPLSSEPLETSSRPALLLPCRLPGALVWNAGLRYLRGFTSVEREGD